MFQTDGAYVYLWPIHVDVCQEPTQYYCKVIILQLKIIIKEKTFLSGISGKNLPDSAGDTRDTGSILGSRRCPGEGNDNPL